MSVGPCLLRGLGSSQSSLGVHTLTPGRSWDSTLRCPDVSPQTKVLASLDASIPNHVAEVRACNVQSALPGTSQG